MTIWRFWVMSRQAAPGSASRYGEAATNAAAAAAPAIASRPTRRWNGSVVPSPGPASATAAMGSTTNTA